MSEFFKIKMTRYFIVLFIMMLIPGLRTEKKKILIIGDSISIGYTPFVRDALADKAIVVHNPGNAQHTGTGLAKLDEWLGTEKWDIIQFNWGLWDLCYRSPNSAEPGQKDKINGAIEFSVEEYKSNLEMLVKKLLATRAKLVFVTTTYVPEGEPGRFAGDDIRYNKAALEVMKKYDIPVNNIYKASMRIHAKEGLAENDVHYTQNGYKLLADKITKFLKKKYSFSPV